MIHKGLSFVNSFCSIDLLVHHSERRHRLTLSFSSSFLKLFYFDTDNSSSLDPLTSFQRYFNGPCLICRPALDTINVFSSKGVVIFV